MEPEPISSLPTTATNPRRLPQETLGTLILVAILAIGVWLRFANLGLVRHNYDDSYPAYDALRMLDGHQLLLSGQASSVFLDNPVLMSYLQAIPLLVWRSPYGVYLFVVALNAVAIWLVYRTGRALLGQTVGLVAALLFAANPWVVFFSRTTWVQALIPFFTALIAWALWPALVEEKPSAARASAGLVAAVAMMQTYIQAWGVLAQLVPLVALFRRRLPRRALLVGGLALLVGLAVYFAGLAKVWSNNRPKLARFAAPASLHLTREGIDHAVRLVTGENFDYTYAREGLSDYAARHSASTAVHYFLAAALLAGAGRALAALRRPGQGRRVGAVLLLWFGVPVVLMSFSAFPVHPHYLLLSCPAGHILAAWGLALLFSARWLRPMAAGALIAVAGLAGLQMQRAAQADAAAPAFMPGAEWTLQAGARVGDAVRSLVAESPRPARVVAPWHEAVVSSLSASFVTALEGLQYPNYVVLPGSEPLLYVLMQADPDVTLLGPRAELFPEHTLHLVGGVDISFVRVRPYDREAALALPEVRVDRRSEAGLSLLGYTLAGRAHPGQAIQCTTYWRVDELQPERWGWYVGVSYHLVDPSGRVVTNTGKYGQWGYRWRLGDVYVERMEIPVPADAEPGAYQLEIGLFDPIHHHPFQLIAPDRWGPMVVPVQVGR